MQSQVEVIGGDKFVADLAKATADIPRQVEVANRAAADLALRAALGLADGVGRQAAKAAGSLTTIDAAEGTTLQFGGAGFDFAAGAEFGGGARPTTRQFPPWRGNGDSAGYFVNPGIRATEEPSLTAYEQVTAALAARVFPD